MSKFLYGTRVAFIGEDNKLVEGTVNQSFDDLQIATISMDNGTLEKVPFSRLAVLPEKSGQDVQSEPTTAPIEKSESTITPDEFTKKSVNAITELSKKLGDPGLMLLAIPILTCIHKALFFDEPENV